MKPLYHYTSQRQHLPAILESGELRGRADMAGERPLMWFSAHPFWEPTATKPRMVGGLLVPHAFEEYRDRVGCVRFALPADDARLMHWRRACKFAGIPKRDRWAMVSVGVKAGGDPRQWFALAGPLALDGVRAEQQERANGSPWQPMEATA